MSINGKVSNIPITTESSINSLLIESSLNNYTANVHKNDEQVFSEYTGCDNLVKIEEQEVIKANISLTQKNIKQAKEQINVNIARRQGQPQFRQSLLEAYNYRCAITEYDAQEALEAAHIIPYIETENNHPSNGLLLRADIHTLFDLNLIAINPETMQVQLAPNLLDTYYKEINGKFLRLPKVLAYLPKREALQWRLTQCEWYK